METITSTTAAGEDKHPFPRLRDALAARYRFFEAPLGDPGEAAALAEMDAATARLDPREVIAYVTACSIAPSEWPECEGVETRRVSVPASREHEGRRSITVLLPWKCAQCDGPRGRVADAISYDGSLRLHCDGWENPCGHVDAYTAALAEAARFARLRARRYGERWADENAPDARGFEVAWREADHAHLAEGLAGASWVDVTAWNIGNVLEPAVQAAARRWRLHHYDDAGARAAASGRG